MGLYALKLAMHAPIAIGFDLLTSLVVALGVGLLIGAERERNKGNGPARNAAGIRTFVLVALLGDIAASANVIMLVPVLGLAVCSLAVAAYWRTRQDDPGLTTEIALLVTYTLGVFAVSYPQLAAALGVLVALLLVSRSWLHELIKRQLSDREVLDGLLLAAAALIILPLLPDHAFDPYGVINPRLIWRITVLVLVINAAGYIAMRTFKSSHGLALAGFLGGFVSSTATIAAMSVHSRTTPSWMRAAAAGAALSSLATVLQLMMILYLTNPPLANRLLAALLVVMLIAIFYAGWLARDAGQVQLSTDLPGGAFELKNSFGFALLVTAVMFIAAFLADCYGALGASVGIALIGFADAHSATASAATLAAHGRLPNNTAIMAVVLAVSTNTLSKIIVAFVSGDRAFALRVAVGLMMMTVALWMTVILTVFH